MHTHNYVTVGYIHSPRVRRKSVVGHQTNLTNRPESTVLMKASRVLSMSQRSQRTERFIHVGRYYRCPDFMLRHRYASSVCVECGCVRFSRTICLVPGWLATIVELAFQVEEKKKKKNEAFSSAGRTFILLLLSSRLLYST